MHIDMERDRALLGLPPKAPLLPGPIKVLFAALLVLGVVTLLGGGLRQFLNRNEESSIARLYSQMNHEQDTDTFRQLLLRIRNLAPNTGEGRMQTGEVMQYAAGRLPEQTLLQQEALLNFREALALGFASERGNPDFALKKEVHTRMAISGLLLDLGQDKAAKAEAENLRAQYAGEDFWPELEDNYTNLLAYILASAKDPTVRNPAEAQRLMDPLMTSSDFAKRIPAYLDTWAECYYASGKPARAVEIQRQALAGASGHELSVYIEHFRSYQAAAARLPAPAQD